jgi:hypothetical protein
MGGRRCVAVWGTIRTVVRIFIVTDHGLHAKAITLFIPKGSAFLRESDQCFHAMPITCWTTVMVHSYVS